MSLYLPAGRYRIAIHRGRAARGEAAIEVVNLDTGQTHYALDCVEWDGNRLERNPDPEAKPAFSLNVNRPITLT